MSKIPNSPEEIFAEFTADYQQAFAGDLLSIFLYGSGAKGEYVPKKSDLNFLIILQENGIENLDKAIPFIPKWRKRNVSVPLFLSEDYIRSSLDTFPIEFLSMKKHHKLVFGQDILTELQIDQKHLRLQAERELRGKLLYLRAGFLSTGHDREALKEMISSSVTALSSIFEAVLDLKQCDLSDSTTGIFEKTADQFDLDKSVFGHIANVKRGEWRGSREQLQDLSKAYIKQVRKLIAVVDKM
ncbi:MAG: hypothetical protein ACE5IR_06070 [bacterium]